MCLSWSSFCRGCLTRPAVECTYYAIAAACGLYYSWLFGYSWKLAVRYSLCVIGLRWISLRFAVERDTPNDRSVVLVTGCDTGLGYSLALHLRSMGFRVVASVHRPDSPGALELSRIEDIFVHQLDITNIESVNIFRTSVHEYLEENQYVLYGFVNNAGAMIFGEFEWQTDDQMRHQIEVNLIGTMRITHEFMPIIRNDYTRIIVVTSHCADEPLPGVGVYGATKAALSAWATSLRVELKKYSIDVVSFVPGSFVRESNLMSEQKNHFATMYAAMDPETRDFYGDYFTRYSNYLSNIAPSDLPRRLMDQRVYNVFEEALLARFPNAVYRCESWRYMFYRIMFKIPTTKFRDRLVEWFVCLPAWEPNNAHLNRSAKGA